MSIVSTFQNYGSFPGAYLYPIWTIYCILILDSQPLIPAIGCRLDPCLDVSCLPGRVYLIIVRVPWCHGGSGISGDTAEGRGMMREDEQSPRAGGSSGRGDVLCCLVGTQSLGLRGKSPPLLLLSSSSPPLLLMINFTLLSLVTPTHGLVLSCHTQSFLASKHHVSHFVDLILALNNLCFSPWMQCDGAIWWQDLGIEIYMIFCQQ